uniref:Snake venom serine protease Dav-X n=1 Tax=Lygus hesperus TaxID=30085 RepID=A0A0A9X541_LYGHE
MFKIFLMLVVQGRLVVGEFGGYYIAGKAADPERDPPRYYSNDPEPRNSELETKYVEDFKKKVPGEERLIGDMFAGRAEFPWIANIRFVTQDDDQELFSTGNILSRSRILTTCRLVLYANGYRKETKQEYPGGRQVIDLDTIIGLRYSMNLLEEKVEIKVIYCANFLWLKYKYAIESKTHFPGDHNIELSYEGGETNVRHIAAHPKCEEDGLIYDFAILALASNIIPVPPTLTYIPVELAESLDDIGVFDLTKHTQERRLCFVSSFGYSYINSPNPKTLDYKVKYRSYYMNWDSCSRLWDLLASPSPEGVDKPYWCPQHEKTCKVDDQTRFHLMCFTTRAKIGSVCDHDRGSPLVCDNRVYGFVTRGAEFKYCSTQMHVPFLVVKITAITDYFRQSAFSKYRMKRSPDPDLIPSWKPHSSASSIEFARVLFTGMVFKILTMDFRHLSLLLHH